MPSSTALLPVHDRRTLRADGTILEVLTVFCSVKARSVPTRQCTDCARCQIVVLGKNESPRFVMCDSGPQDAKGESRVAASPHGTPVWGAMSSAVLCVEPDVRPGDLAEVLVDPSIDCAPVIDSDGVLLGVVSRLDLMRWHWRDGAPAVSVQSLMRPAPRIFALTPVATAGALMASEAIGAITVVVSEERPVVVGVITARDVMAWLAHPAGHPRERHLPGADA